MVFATAAAALAGLAAMMVFFASLRRVFPGFREWALAQVLGALGLVLLGLRGLAPELLSVIAANVLILAHPIVALRGFRRFYGLAAPRGLGPDVGLLVAAVTLLGWYTWIDPNLPARVIIFGVVGASLHTYCALAPLAAPEARSNRTQRVLSGAFLALALGYLARALWHVFSVPASGGLLADPTIGPLVLLVVATQVVFVCGLVYLNFERAADALIEKEERLRFAQEAARAGSWEMDLSTGRTFWSGAMWDLYGLAQGSREPSQEAWLETVCPEDRARVVAAVELARAGAELEVEWRVGGSHPTRWLMTRGRRLGEGDGRAVRLVGIVLDVTDRKQAEEGARAIERAKALSDSEARFRGLIEKSTDVVVVIDAERVIRFFSPGGTAALGWAEAEMVGHHPPEFIHPDDEPTVARAFQSLLAQPADTTHVTYRFRHRDGSWRVLDAAARNHLGDSVLGGIVVNARDITEQVRLRERLADAQRLESIGQLAGGVAHDFNNLLTAILGGAECARDSIDEGALPQRDDIEMVLDAAKRASELTHQLLAFARRQPLAAAPVALGALTREMERLIRRLLPESIALTISEACDPWLVRADAGQLRQVILNLASNARDAMPSGGQLTIETRKRVLDAEEAVGAGAAAPGEYVCLCVRDTGVGISLDAQAHLFEPFFTTKALGRGTGLGLAAVHGIVKQLGGGIVVESEPGRGTAMHISLPRCSPEPSGPRPTAETAVGGGERVLLVEDERLVRQVAERTLRKAGYEVLVAQDGDEALALAIPEGSVSLLITDVVMPGLDGSQLAGRLKARHRGLKVLYVSGFTADTIAHHGVLDEGVELLEKPFIATELLERVRRVLDGAGANSD